MSGVIGAPSDAPTAEAKVTGAATYCLDRELPRMLHAKLLRSPVAAGTDHPPRHRAAPGAARRPRGGHRGRRPAAVRACSSRTSRCSPTGIVRYIGEPVAAVAADTLDGRRSRRWPRSSSRSSRCPPSPRSRPRSRTARRSCTRTWETYAPSAIEGERDGNRLWEAELTRGDVAAAFARDDVVVRRGRVPRAAPAPELHRAALRGRAASRPAATSCTPRRSSRRLYATAPPRRSACRSSAVRIVADTVGGGFGGKLDAGPEPYAALSRASRGARSSSSTPAARSSSAARCARTRSSSCAPPSRATATSSARRRSG